MLAAHEREREPSTLCRTLHGEPGKLKFVPKKRERFTGWPRPFELQGHNPRCDRQRLGATLRRTRLQLLYGHAMYRNSFHWATSFHTLSQRRSATSLGLKANYSERWTSIISSMPNSWNKLPQIVCFTACHSLNTRAYFWVFWENITVTGAKIPAPLHHQFHQLSNYKLKASGAHLFCLP